jgi:hypothetical protein
MLRTDRESMYYLRGMLRLHVLAAGSSIDW